MRDYDVVIIGGGVAGSAVAGAVAAHGLQVLVLERERRFRDRVRGEFMFPWGVAEAVELGVYDDLVAAGAHHPELWTDYAGPRALPARDFAQDTPQQLRGLCIYHPRLQETLLEAARKAGAEVWRGALVTSLEPGLEPRVRLAGGPVAEVSARIVVGADGRASRTRRWAGFSGERAEPGNNIAGVLLENVPAPESSSICMINPAASRMVIYFPQGPGVGRAYLVWGDGAQRSRPPLTDVAQFLAECNASGLAPELLEGARAAGPLATFPGADSWVTRPYREGVVLVGDAGSTSDPTWGQGLSLALRDARALRDALLASDDWSEGASYYAAQHDRYAGSVRMATSWYTQVFLRPGPESDALRERVLPQLMTDPLLMPETLTAGPDLAAPTAEQRMRIFGT